LTIADRAPGGDTDGNSSGDLGSDLGGDPVGDAGENFVGGPFGDLSATLWPTPEMAP
jgi:hypothetical protein